MSPRGRTRPDRSLEKALLETYDYVGGLDEVGRGALAGPVSVGLAIVARRTDDDFPEGLADSKQLTARARTGLVEPVRGWLVDHAVAHASPAEIDEHGIIGALRMAGLRALQQVADRGHAPGVIILDGVADWLTALEGTHAPKDSPEPAEVPSTPPVRMEVKADARCAVVAAASVLAKVERDRLMADLDDPGYGWASNKGYASPAHVRGLTALGASDQHRRSWHLPGLDRRHR
ncbi:ribonuclease HII [Actinomyces oris]|uniref:Ribonuclease n=1 Tax=Actinomyces oris TaxID=544580 RepID=A0AAW8L5I8_9ACTO|nr:ribonuclease HII [Actinomyces oris]MDR0177262.1 ribonuclease HII [Actinomyces oris]